MVSISGLYGQSTMYTVSGKIQDDTGEILSFSTIYDKSSLRGTTSNNEGFFSLKLDEGEHSLVVQYVGYADKIVNIDLIKDITKLIIQLTPEAYVLNEVVIAADVEDPAYRVIRAAQAKRQYHLDQVPQFQCEVYMKGNQKLLNAPKKVLGQEVGDFDGALDSTGSGIVYLSESITDYYVKGNERKEILKFSKYSGNDNGFSFNSVAAMDFNFYRNTVGVNRELISPIAKNALQYYRYELVGTQYDRVGRLINKIKVIPKRTNEPVVSGEIYIIEDDWHIHSLSLKATKKATQIPVLDSLLFRQIYLPIRADIWMIQSNIIEFDLSFFGTSFDGSFVANYVDYDIDTQISDDIFDAVVLKVDDDANKKDEDFWTDYRPMPLTEEEATDYERRDSIKTLRESKAYLDSIDSKQNKFKITSFLFGYTYQNSFEKNNVSFSSPLSNIHFNTVQGFHTTAKMKFTSEDRKNDRSVFSSSIGLNYGFSENKLRGRFDMQYRMGNKKSTQFALELGSELRQIEPNQISPTINSLYSLFFRRNYASFYNSEFIRSKFKTEIVNGLDMEFTLGHENRSRVDNNSDFSYFYKNSRQYFDNNSGFTFDDIILPDNKVLQLGVTATIHFDRKYYDYPKFKIYERSKYPRLRLSVKAQRSLNTGFTDYTLTEAKIDKQYQIRNYGFLKFYVNGGLYIGDTSSSFVDNKHFLGNQTFITNRGFGLNRFFRMPYYQYSTDDKFLQVHMEHNFEGFITGKLGRLGDLGWNVVAGSKYLAKQGNDYWELNVGLDNLGVGIFRLFRFDIIYSSHSNDVGYVLSIKL